MNTKTTMVFLQIIMMLFTSMVFVQSEECTRADHQHCASWKQAGDCDKDDIVRQCPRTCGRCGTGSEAKDGAWSTWSTWTTCTQSCGGGEQKKFRRCNNPPPYHGGLECLSTQRKPTSYEELIQTCNTDACKDTCSDRKSTEICTNWKKSDLCSPTSVSHEHMIDLCKRTCGFCGSWSAWGPYTMCNVTCGGKGVRERSRRCNNTESSPQTLYCLTKIKTIALVEKELLRCYKRKECPVDGGWSIWSTWSGCSCRNLEGFGSRYRMCNNPRPKAEGIKCISKNGTTETFEEESKSCVGTLCTVNGEWSPWSKVRECKCVKDKGIGRRYRECNQPPPQGEGLMCLPKHGKRVNYEDEEKDCTEISCTGKVKGTTFTAYVIGAIVAGGVIVLLLIIVIILYAKKKKRKYPKEDSLTAWNRDDDLDEQQMDDPYSQVIHPKPVHTYEEDGEEVYAEANTVSTLPTPPFKPNEIVYTDVGKGGGRIGYRFKADESNYAQVKTEGTYYPPCNTTDDPPVYTLPSRDYFTNDRVPTYDRNNYASVSDRDDNDEYNI